MWGKGKFTWPSLDYFIGDFYRNELHGGGTKVTTTGETTESRQLNNDYHGVVRSSNHLGEMSSHYYKKGIIVNSFKTEQ